MGIINLTDDSYFARSRCADVSEVLERFNSMMNQGADIIDIGACSTRPGADMVGWEEQWRRLSPSLKAIRKEFPDVVLSVDTTSAQVVRRVHDQIGDFIVNDISAGEDDPEMLPVVGRLGLGYIAMHKRGNPATMQTMTVYDDIVSDIMNYFYEFSLKAACNSIRNWILDPGFGFAKTREQNFELLSSLSSFTDPVFSPKPRILVGLSRKSMIYKTFDITPEESLAQTQVLHLKALQMGADILRVHDVAEAGRTVELYRLLG